MKSSKIYKYDVFEGGVVGEGFNLIKGSNGYRHEWKTETEDEKILYKKENNTHKYRAYKVIDNKLIYDSEVVIVTLAEQKEMGI